MFYILEGNNGATYILNIRSLQDIKQSLNFYKARTLKQKIQKNVLIIYLMVLKVFGFKLQSLDDIKVYLSSLSDVAIDYGLDTNCSVLVSPTRDKVIVHHHDEYFEKFAFAKSYANVKKESEVYELLNTKHKHFKVSKFYDKVDTSHYCSFKLSNVSNEVMNDVDMTLALVEFFSITLQTNVSFFSYIDTLVKECRENKPIGTLLKKYKTLYADESISSGLVHRDFKPWNIKYEDGLLIFDFEEAITDGLPLEDMLNFRVDPIIRYQDTKVVYEHIFDHKSVEEYKRYLDLLGIKIDFVVFLNLYIINRVVFWEKAKDSKASQCYMMLFEYINQKKLY